MTTKQPDHPQGLAAKYPGLFDLHDTAIPRPEPGKDRTEAKSGYLLDISVEDIFAHVPDGPAKVAAREAITAIDRHPIRIYRTGGGYGIDADRKWKQANWAKFRRTALLFWEEAFEVVVTNFGWMISSQENQS